VKKSVVLGILRGESFYDGKALKDWEKKEG